MKLTRIADISNEPATIDTGEALTFTLEGKPRTMFSGGNRLLLAAGWVRLDGLTDQELQGPDREVTFKGTLNEITLPLDRQWTDDPEVVYLARRWYVDKSKRILPPGPYDPGEDGPILE